MSWQKEKQRKLRLDLNARRKEYSCRGNFVPLEKIPTWRQQWCSQQDQEQPVDDLNTRESLKTSDLSDKVSLYVGDITQLEIDAIVNAANNSLLGGGGVDGAIHRAAGPNLRKENQTLRGCPDGEAKISCGYNLPAKYVISTVGPRGEKPAVLAAAYRNCLQVMLENNLRSAAFPCISTGIYGYPNASAAQVALQTVRTFLEKHHQAVDRIIFCLFLEVDVDLYERMMPQFFPIVVDSAPSASDPEATATNEKAANGTPTNETAADHAEDEPAAANEKTNDGMSPANEVEEEMDVEKTAEEVRNISPTNKVEEHISAANEESPSDSAAIEESPSDSAANEELPSDSAANENSPSDSAANGKSPSDTAASVESPKRRKQEESSV